MELTLKNAIAKAKREFEKYGFGGYSSINGLWQTMKIIYHLRDDEKEDFFNSMAKWSNKNNLNLKAY